MSDCPALHAAVCADPDDDTPRLVYADWLDENGESRRAAFIRAQIEYARATPYSPEARSALSRAAELERGHHNEWAESVVGLVSEHVFERGFVGCVTADVGTLERHADRIFRSEPIRGLRLLRYPNSPQSPSFETIRSSVGPGTQLSPLGAGNRGSALAHATREWVSLRGAYELPHLRRIRVLEFTLGGCRDLLDEDYEALLHCPNLGSVEDLSFPQCPVAPDRIAELLESDALPGLTGLAFPQVTHVGERLSAALHRCTHRRLKRLDLTGVYFTSESLRRLVQSPPLREIEELRLGCLTPRNGFGPAHYFNLGWVLPWDRLYLLDLSGQQIGDENLREITRNPDARGLRWLGLANNGLAGEAVRELLESRYLDLYLLDVSGNFLSDDHIAQLRRRFPNAVIVH